VREAIEDLEIEQRCSRVLDGSEAAMGTVLIEPMS
jgi:hypothetical protein